MVAMQKKMARVAKTPVEIKSSRTIALPVAKLLDIPPAPMASSLGKLADINLCLLSPKQVFVSCCTKQPRSVSRCTFVYFKFCCLQIGARFEVAKMGGFPLMSPFGKGPQQTQS